MDLVDVSQGPAAAALIVVGGVALAGLIGFGHHFAKKNDGEGNHEAILPEVQQPDDPRP